jgi:hypothetical protein
VSLKRGGFNDPLAFLLIFCFAINVRRYIYLNKETPMSKDYKNRINAIVVISENTNSVMIHFEGFEDFYEAKDFSEYMVEELGINTDYYNLSKTIH